MQITKQTTLIILDWDDTLFPTNWVMKRKINLLKASERDQYTDYFQELDRVLFKLLEIVNSMGTVVIVTNAMLNWVDVSSIVLPRTYAILKKVKIISARARYKKISSSAMEWKRMAFTDVVYDELKTSSPMNIISVGDAEYEYRALISLNNKYKNPNKYLKSVKFMRNPTHDKLIDQLEVLKNAVIDVWSKEQHLDLVFDNK